MEQQMIEMQSQKTNDMDFDLVRTFTVLTATLVIPVYLALSVVSFSIVAI